MAKAAALLLLPNVVRSSDLATMCQWLIQFCHSVPKRVTGHRTCGCPAAAGWLAMPLQIISLPRQKICLQPMKALGFKRQNLLSWCIHDVVKASCANDGGQCPTPRIACCDAHPIGQSERDCYSLDDPPDTAEGIWLMILFFSLS